MPFALAKFSDHKTVLLNLVRDYKERILDSYPNYAPKRAGLTGALMSVAASVTGSDGVERTQASPHYFIVLALQRAAENLENLKDDQAFKTKYGSLASKAQFLDRALTGIMLASMQYIEKEYESSALASLNNDPHNSVVYQFACHNLKIQHSDEAMEKGPFNVPSCYHAAYVALDEGYLLGKACGSEGGKIIDVSPLRSILLKLIEEAIPKIKVAAQDVFPGASPEAFAPLLAKLQGCLDATAMVEVPELT